MRSYTFTVPGTPVPNERARSGNGRHYTPERTRKYRDHVRACFVEQCMPTAKLEGPLHITVNVCRDVAPTAPGDLDNYVKTIKDALNKVAYDDDRQVVEIVAVKERCGEDGPEVMVYISKVEE